MSTIIAGRFQQQEAVDDAIEDLVQAGFPRESIASFFVNPAGQHDVYAIGGDHAESAGAHESKTGVVKGAATGAVVGAAATAVLGPIGTVTGALLGAHVGGLLGGLSKMKERGEAGVHGEDADNAAPVRRSGMMLAVAVGEQENEADAINALRVLGAEDIERASGTIADSEWDDFDPLSVPELVEPAAGSQQASSPVQRM
ncbi:MAG TPA: hypothetical protein VJ654_15650 [Noviherbaspirillum sp.]|nr:hypothetical protein [Noviherbaspirillum sp.]